MRSFETAARSLKVGSPIIVPLHSETPVEQGTIVMAKYDVLPPNALGALDDDTIPRLHGRVIAGATASRPDVKAAV
jgi:hypothetical protein